MTSRQCSIGSEGWTNTVLIQQQKQKIIYYIPCYLRIKIKNFIEINIASLEAEINADLLFTIYYGTVPECILTQLDSNIIFQFNRNESLQLARSIEISMNKNVKQRTLSFTVRKSLKTKVDSNFFWSPFQLINLALVVTIRSMIIPYGNKQLVVRFNLMDTQMHNIKISFTKQDYFGNYRLAPSKLKVFYSKQSYYDPGQHNRIDEEESTNLITIDSQLDHSDERFREEEQNVELQEQKIQYFQYAHFVIPMYKLPFVSLSTIFVPMWSLSFYNLFMFYQTNDLSMHISNGVTLILSLFAYVPTIRQQLPDTPQIILAQILVYSIAVTFHLNIVDGYVASLQDPETYKMVWSENIYFLITLGVTILSILIVIVLLLMHKFKWQPSYLISDPIFNKSKFNRDHWKNQECDRYFGQFKRIKILK